MRCRQLLHGIILVVSSCLLSLETRGWADLILYSDGGFTSPGARPITSSKPALTARESRHSSPIPGGTPSKDSTSMRLTIPCTTVTDRPYTGPIWTGQIPLRSQAATEMRWDVALDLLHGEIYWEEFGGRRTPSIGPTSTEAASNC